MTSPSADIPPARQIAQRCFRIVDGRLCIGQIPVDELANEFGTPLFVYDAAVVQRRLQELNNALHGEFDIFFSMKANPLQSLLRFLIARGRGIEVASAGELYQARHAGCPPQRILFAGPGKTVEELESAIAADVAEIHAESLLEVERIAEIGQRLGKRARIALRINPTGEVQGGAMRMGGKPSVFGIDEECLTEAVDRVEATPAVELQGIHLFTGTQILDAEILAGQYDRAIDLAVQVAQQIKRPLQTIDFGGGLGVPYHHHDSPLDLTQLSALTAKVINRVRSHPLLRTARLIVEPGRFLIAEAGIYLARVTDIKNSRGRKFLVTDGGMHHHLAASGNLGQTIKRNFPVALVERMDAIGTETVDVVGSLCTPLDVLARQATLPKATVGDLFGVFQSGAYARSASPSGFLSHPAAAEIWIEDGLARIARRRGEPGDLLRDQMETGHRSAAAYSAGATAWSP